MTPAETQDLLEQLCVQLGFCLPADERARLAADPPAEPDAFAEAVFQAEGLALHEGGMRLFRQVRATVAEAMERASPDPAAGA